MPRNGKLLSKPKIQQQNASTPASPPVSRDQDATSASRPKATTQSRGANSAPKVRLPRLPTSTRRPAQVNTDRPKTTAMVSSSAATPVRPHSDRKLLPKPNQLWDAVSTRANTYYATLKDPFNVYGVRIPDSINYPSATFSITKRITLTASSSGVAAVGLGWYAVSGMTNNVGHLIPINNATSSQSFVLGMANGTSATSTDVFCSTATGQGTQITLDQWQSGTLTVPGLYQQVRLVSAGVACNSTASLSNLQGVWRAGFAPPNYYNNRTASASPNAIRFDDIGVLPNSVESTVNTGEGVTVTFSPEDLTAFTYCDTGNTASGGYDFDHSDLGCMFIAATGLAVNTTLTCLIVLNYEGIPQTNALNFITTHSSIDDPLMLADALNRREEEPWAVSGTDEATKLDHPDHPLHELENQTEKVLHIANNKVTSVGGSTVRLAKEERKQVGLLEGVFKEFVPLLERGFKGLVDTVKI